MSTAQTRRRSPAAGAAPLPALLAVLLAGTAGAAGAAEPAGTTLVPVPAPAFVIDAADLNHERADNAVIEATRKALGRTGRDAPARTREMALREAALLALHKNLDVRRSHLRRAIAERALTEADAVFDPVFLISVGAALRDQFRRVEHPNKFKPNSEFIPVGTRDSSGTLCTESQARLDTTTGRRGCHRVMLGKNSPVQFIEYDRERKAGYYNTEVVANQPPIEGPLYSYTGAASIQQQLPWGGRLDLTLATTFKNTFYVNNRDNPTVATFGAYGRPWISVATFAADHPLPFTRGFGRLAPANADRDTAKMGIEAAEFDARSVINTTLLNVDTVYWTLVGAVQRLNAAAQSLKLAEEMQKRVRRRYELELAVESDRAQAEAQVARLRAAQQRLFAEYVAASEQLRQLLDSEEDALVLPVGYRAVLAGAPATVQDGELSLNNPAYQRQAVAVRIADLARAVREDQTRPDLRATGSAQFSQSNGVFGYSYPGQSLANLYRPDKIELTIGLLYQRPWGNRAAKADLERAGHEVRQQQFLLDKLGHQVRNDFETARAELASARERIAITGRALDLAQALYDRVLRLQEEDLVGAYEALARLADLQEARAARIQAKVDARIAESRLLASVGALADRYGERTAQTAQDRERLVLLRESGELKTFGGPL